MPVAVAHQTSRYSQAVLAEAVREAAQRGEELFVISVEKAADEDHRAALTASIGDDLVAAASAAQVPLAPWTLDLEAATSEVDDTADAILAAVDRVGAGLLVIGARRRSPMGKALLGSVTQSLILDATVPVLVVKAPG
jgi:nucleotide-binding universal stress UspA family protein